MNSIKILVLEIPSNESQSNNERNHERNSNIPKKIQRELKDTKISNPKIVPSNNISASKEPIDKGSAKPKSVTSTLPNQSHNTELEQELKSSELSISIKKEEVKPDQNLNTTKDNKIDTKLKIDLGIPEPQKQTKDRMSKKPDEKLAKELEKANNKE